jgi:hypothetical protein
VQLKGGLLGDSLESLDELLEKFGVPEDYPLPIIGSEKQLQFLTIGASDLRAFVGSGPYWIDADGDGEYFDINPDTGERTPEAIDEEAIGLVLDDLDFGMAIMMPTLAFDPARYIALRASASTVSFTGVDGLTIRADEILVEVNMSSPTVYGMPIFPTVAFESSFPAEIDLDQDGHADVNELLRAYDRPGRRWIPDGHGSPGCTGSDGWKQQWPTGAE